MFEFVLMVVVVASERYRERLQLSSERPFSSSSHERAALHRRSSFVTPSLAHLAPPHPRCLAASLVVRSSSLPLLCRRASSLLSSISRVRRIHVAFRVYAPLPPSTTTTLLLSSPSRLCVALSSVPSANQPRASSASSYSTASRAY